MALSGALGGSVNAPPGSSLIQLAARFTPWVKPYARICLALGAFVLLAPVLSSASIWMSGVLIDDVLAPRRLDLLPIYCGAFLGLTLLSAGFSFTHQYVAAWLGEHITLDVQRAVYQHLLRVSPETLGGQRLGDVLTRLSSDAGAVDDLLVGSAISVAVSVLSLLYYGVALMLMNIRLAALILVVIPPLFIATAEFAQRLRRASRELRRLAGRKTAIAEETLSYLPLVQAYVQEMYESDRFQSQGRRAIRARLSATRLSAINAPLLTTIGACGGLLVIWAGAHEVVQGQLTVGALVATMGYVRALYSPLASLAGLVGSLQAGAAAVERVAELLDLPIAVRSPDLPLQVQRAHGRLELRDVWFGYRPDEPVLRGLDLTIEPGQTVALVGRTGTGKTTVAKLLQRLHDPWHGEIRFDDQNLRTLCLDDLRRQFGLVPQEATVFDGTVEENIRYGRRDATHDQVVQAARLARAHSFVRRLPDGYRTRVGQKGCWLSGGQRQRLALARALLSNGSVLILDEATASVDAASERLIQDSLERFRGTRTVIVIAHRLSSVMQADTIVVLAEGRIVEQGTHLELLGRGGAYAALFGAQSTMTALSAAS